MVESGIVSGSYIGAPGGNFILSTCSSFGDAIPPENALAMVRTANTYGGYGQAVAIG